MEAETQHWVANLPTGCALEERQIFSISTGKEFNMSLEKRVEAIAKNLEGKVQETVGELTGNEKQKREGQMKQVQASAMNAREDLKDKAKKIIDKA
jgi:uncharacterized protein YjbJ (UPF0337 family)